MAMLVYQAGYRLNFQAEVISPRRPSGMLSTLSSFTGSTSLWQIRGRRRGHFKDGQICLISEDLLTIIGWLIYLVNNG